MAPRRRRRQHGRAAAVGAGVLCGRLGVCLLGAAALALAAAAGAGACECALGETGESVTQLMERSRHFADGHVLEALKAVGLYDTVQDPCWSGTVS